MPNFFSTMYTNNTKYLFMQRHFGSFWIYLFMLIDNKVFNVSKMHMYANVTTFELSSCRSAAIQKKKLTLIFVKPYFASAILHWCVKLFSMFFFCFHIFVLPLYGIYHHIYSVSSSIGVATLKISLVAENFVVISCLF